MALEALDIFFQYQQQDSAFFPQCTSKDPLQAFLYWAPDFNDGGGGEDCFLDNQTEAFSLLRHSVKVENVIGSSSPEINGGGGGGGGPSSSSSPEGEAEPPPAKKARRARSRKKNKEEIESQRMTHIAVERNRRKQMNEYLSVLRSLMPDSYVQRRDQASVIGGAINFVKELEQRLQHLGAILRRKDTKRKSAEPPSLAEFFTFPQHSSSSSCSTTSLPQLVRENSANVDSDRCKSKPMGPCGGRVGDVEVTMVESHANVRIWWRKQARQLLRLVTGLQSLRLSVLYLNVTTATDDDDDDDDRRIMFYSLSLKVEDDCRLNTGDEIATAVYEMLDSISEEA